MKARRSSSICSKARRAFKRATSCALRRKFLQPVRKPSRIGREGFLLWPVSYWGASYQGIASATPHGRKGATSEAAENSMLPLILGGAAVYRSITHSFEGARLQP